MDKLIRMKYLQDIRNICLYKRLKTKFMKISGDIKFIKTYTLVQ